MHGMYVKKFPHVAPSARIIKILKILGCNKTSTFLDSTLLVRTLNAEALQSNTGKGKIKVHLSTGHEGRKGE